MYQHIFYVVFIVESKDYCLKSSPYDNKIDTNIMWKWVCISIILRLYSRRKRTIQYTCLLI